MEGNKWSDLTIKEKSAIVSAFIAFGLGWALSIAGFIIEPCGEVADSVLWILGQSLIYTASVFGLTSYFNAESKRMRSEMDETIRRFRKEIDDDNRLQDNTTHIIND